MMKRFLTMLLALVLAVSSVPALADGLQDDAPVWGVVRNYSNQAIRVKMYMDADDGSDLVAEANCRGDGDSYWAGIRLKIAVWKQRRRDETYVAARDDVRVQHWHDEPTAQLL